uniref:Uncharacterized protein n=1 Tax=Romanomermis culicivorax TaxID=13658 RepID=A0A915KA25_ROMCU
MDKPYRFLRLGPAGLKKLAVRLGQYFPIDVAGAIFLAALIVETTLSRLRLFGQAFVPSAAAASKNEWGYNGHYVVDHVGVGIGRHVAQYLVVITDQHSVPRPLTETLSWKTAKQWKFYMQPTQKL